MKLLLYADTHLHVNVCMCAKGQDKVHFFFFFTAVKKIRKAVVLEKLVNVLKNI